MSKQRYRDRRARRLVGHARLALVLAALCALALAGALAGTRGVMLALHFGIVAGVIVLAGTALACLYAAGRLEADTLARLAAADRYERALRAAQLVSPAPAERRPAAEQDEVVVPRPAQQVPDGWPTPAQPAPTTPQPADAHRSEPMTKPVIGELATQ